MITLNCGGTPLGAWPNIAYVIHRRVLKTQIQQMCCLPQWDVVLMLTRRKIMMLVLVQPLSYTRTIVSTVAAMREANVGGEW